MDAQNAAHGPRFLFIIKTAPAEAGGLDFLTTFLL